MSEPNTDNPSPASETALPEPPPLPEAPPSPRLEVLPAAAPGAHRRRIAQGLVLIVLSCAFLAYIGHVEEAWRDAVPWGHALARISKDAPPEGTRAARFRKMPQESLPEDSPLVKAVREVLGGPDAASLEAEGNKQVIDILGGNLAEMVILLPASPEELAQTLESGRLPTPGAPEALRGPLARMNSFQLDGETFQVVGRLKQNVGGGAFAYFIPEEEGIAARHFTPGQGAQMGWFAPDARTLAPGAFEKVLGGKSDEATQEQEKPEDAAPKPDANPTEPESNPFVEQPFAQVPTRPAYVVGCLVALVLGAAGGYLLHAGLFRALAARRGSGAFRVFHAVAAYPRLFLAMHLLLYGAFFFAMLRGALLPLNNIAVAQFVAGEFTSGGLSYIGEAYASGHIGTATLATFYNNYYLQTLMLTFVASLVPVAFGIVKTLFSFVLTGFTMTPIWAGTAAGFSYHNITMVLELEAYIVACFFVALWTYSCWRRILSALFRTHAPALPSAGLTAYFQAALLTGVMLAIAAAYEATTLILIGGR